MKIAGIDLGDKPLFLAPMEDVTDPSFRYVCKMFGADMVYTEFISCDGLIRDAAKTVAKLRLYDYERPVGIQLYGHQIEPMVEAARVAEAAGPDLIDINFGCPVRKIAGRGAGSGMMRDVPKMVEMTRRIVEAVRLPVTVKTRLGWDEDSRNIVEIAERLQDAGIAALTIHGRTRAQMYRGEADWTLIGEVKRNPRMRIPIVGNGDIDSGEKAAEAFERYGVDGDRSGDVWTSMDIPGDQAVSVDRRADEATFGARTGRTGEAASGQIARIQGRKGGRAGDETASVVLFQRTARFQGDPAEAGHADRSGADRRHARRDRPRVGRLRRFGDCSQAFVARSVIVPFSAGLSVEWPKDRKCPMQTLRKGFSVPAAVGS